MRYLPTIDVHEKATQQAIVSGQIKLQPGQWVACSNSRKSRYVGVTSGGAVLLAHYNGSPEAQRQRFNDLKEVLGK